MKKYEEMSFPKREWANYKKQLEETGCSSSTRCCNELGKYKEEHIYKTPWGDIIIIKKVTRYYKVEEIPTWHLMDKGMKISVRIGQQFGEGKWDHVIFEKINSNDKTIDRSDMTDKKLIAPCGMNCALCLAYQRVKNHCPGCNGPDENKSKSCLACRITNCTERAKRSDYCIKCKKFPCERIRHLDKRYRTKYGMSMIENQNSIKTIGIRKFLIEQKTKWTCPKCGELLCVHRDVCRKCGHKNKYLPKIDKI